MFKRCKLFVVVLCCLGTNLFGFCSADSNPNSIAPTYQWGRGISFPQANLNFGGYLNTTFESLNSQKPVGALDDLSLFITWSPFARVQLFSELELENYISTEGVTSISQAFKIERLYADYFATDSVTARFGKFLTPVGRWNVLHASPLVWTTSRPLVTDEQMFAFHASGAMISKRFEINDRDLDVSLYVDDSADIDPRKDALDFDQAAGARLNYILFDHLEVGTSYLSFKRSIEFQQAINHLFGVDLLWKKNNFEVQIEFCYRSRGGSNGTEKGLYIQGVAPLGFNVSAVGRYEYLDASQGKFASEQFTTNIGVAGLAWRPYTPLVFKAEYRFGSQNEVIAPSGFMASFAMLF